MRKDSLEKMTGKMRTRYIIAAAAMMLAASAAEARVADSTGFNALDYSMQKRWNPKDEDFARYAFFYLNAGTEQFIRRGQTSFGWGPVAREELGFRVSRYSGVAVGVTAGTLRRNYDARRTYRGGVELLHYFDLTSFVGGYRPDRTVSLYTVEGLGYYKTRCSGVNSRSFSARGGLVLSLNIGGNWHINIEPYADVYSDGIDPGTVRNWRRFDGGYGVTAGLSHRFDFRKSVCYGENGGFGKWFVRDAFIDVAGGAQFYGAGRSASDAVMSETVREHLTLGYGKWLSGPLGVRVSAFLSGNSWDNAAGSGQKSRFAGARGEVVFDPMWYTVRSREHRFSMPFMFGLEAGKFKKTGSDITLDKWYCGLTGGMQLKLRAAEHCSFYVEPRFSVVPYTYRDKVAGRPDFKNWFDTLVNVNFGVEIDL